MNKHLIKFFLLAGIITISGCDKGDKTAQPEKAPAAVEETATTLQEKPAMKEQVTVTMESTVTAVNHETRQVTLQDSSGESVTFIAGEQVRNLAQVDVGDKILVEYADRYAGVTASDHKQLCEAIDDGAIEVVRDI